MSSPQYLQKALANYEAALRDPGPGARHGWFVKMGHLGAHADLAADQVIRDILSCLPGYRDTASIQSGVERAYAAQHKAAAFGRSLPPPPPKSKPAPKTAAHYIAKGAGTCEADFFDRSPVNIWWGDDWRFDTVAQLAALFSPDEPVFLGDKFGKTVRTAGHWIRAIFSGRLAAPPFLVPNPLLPEGGETSDGKHSPRCDAAVATFRHAVAEFDGLPLADQFAFWAGWGLRDVVSLTFSGSKSLHALLRVDAANRGEWDREIREKLFRRTLIPLGCDGACQNPARLSRLAGAARPDKGGTIQKLLYCRPPRPGWGAFFRNRSLARRISA